MVITENIKFHFVVTSLLSFVVDEAQNVLGFAELNKYERVKLAVVGHIGTNDENRIGRLLA